MNQTNYFTRRLSLGHRFNLKSIMLTLGGFLMLSVFGTTISSAQTMSQVAETTSAHVLTLMADEADALEVEMKNPSSSVKTVYNEQLIEYYRSVARSWQSGGDLKDAIKNVDYIHRHTAHDAAVELHPEGQVSLLSGSDVLELHSLVNQLELEDNDDSDLQAIFNFWRTIKNR